MSVESERALANLCSNLQGDLDRDGDECGFQGVLTSVRWVGVESVPFFDVIAEGRVIRVTAEDLGPHTHKWDSTGSCMDCVAYDEDHDESPSGVVVPVAKAADLFANHLFGKPRAPQGWETSDDLIREAKEQGLL